MKAAKTGTPQKASTTQPVTTSVTPTKKPQPAQQMQTILVTGTAGFIGYHLSKKLLEQGYTVIGLDIVNDYYDPIVKQKRNAELLKNNKYIFYKVDITNFEAIVDIAKKHKPNQIIHLAAQAGVRYSIQNPWAYAQSNYIGTLNIFELARTIGLKRVIYASSASVYGSNKKVPFSEDDRTDNAISLYAATKKANEVLAHAYHHMHGIESAGLRFFTAYGKFGRPDLAMFKFCKAIMLDKPIQLYNHGKMARDFTYIDDIVAGIIAAMKKENLGCTQYNLGGDNPVTLINFVKLVEKNLGKAAKIEFVEMQKGDVPVAMADISRARCELGFEPRTKFADGCKIFCDWFLENKEWLLKLQDGK